MAPPRKSISVRKMMANIVEHRGRMIGARADFVHLPGIFVQRDAESLGDVFAFVDQRVEQVAQVGEFVLRARNARQCGSSVSAATELTEALKISFDHCAGLASSRATALRPEATIQSAAVFTSENGVLVGSNGPSQVAVSSSYCT